MRIAHVIDSMDVGGAEAVVAALCRLQRASGHLPSVHCLHRKGALGERLEQEQIPVSVHGPASSLALIHRLYRAFDDERPMVVHCHNKSATVHAALPARLARARVLTTRHGLAALPYRLRKDLKFWVVAAMCCDRVVAVCETAHHNMARGASPLSHKLVTIRNGAYPPQGVAEMPVHRDRFTLVTVGRLVAAKDYATLLRSVARVKESVPDIALRMVGDGPERASLEQLARTLGVEQVVEFCGERADVGAYLHAADVFVLSSISEGLPISILEAMAAGLPAIVTDVGGMPEVINLSTAGVAVPPRDVAALADAILRFSRVREELHELGARARACYVANFTPQQMAAQYLDLYEACLGTRMRPA